VSDAALRRLLWLAVLGLVALAWWGSLDAPFVYDDKIEVVGNRTIRMLERWREIGAYNLSRPLLIFSYAWNFDRFGFDPQGYHLTNLAVHALAIGAALAMVEGVARVFRREHALWRGTAVVALWAVHPMVTESVTYTTGRSETLCALFCFAAVAAWARALLAERAGERAWPWRVAGLSAFVAGALSKEVAVVVPAILVALEWGAAGAEGQAPRARIRRWGWLWIVPFALGIGAAVFVRMQQAQALLPVEVERPLGVQLATSAEVWRHYLRLWLVPVGQTLFHGQADVSPGSLRGLGAIGGWIAMGVAAVVLGRQWPVVGFGLLAAGLTLVPSTSVPMLKEHMAEHRSYQAGLYLLMAIGLGVPLRRRRLAGAISAALVVAALFASRARNAVWQSEVALWEEAAERAPDAAEAWYGLGDARRFAKDFTGAVTAYERALELEPGDLDAWNNLGIAHAEVGDVPRAKDAWRGALDVRPSYCKAHNNLGSLAYRFGEWDEARTELQSTLAYCPDSVVAHYLLGNIYYGPRRAPDKALFHYEAVVALDPYFDHVDVVKSRVLELTW
jgi:protein O-mannosyl-transferase